jgi:hypothetical protein
MPDVLLEIAEIAMENTSAPRLTQRRGSAVKAIGKV